MPIDPGLQAEMQKRGLSVDAAPQAKQGDAGGGLWDEIKKRGLEDKAKPQEESLGDTIWNGLKGFGRGAIQGGMETGQGITQLLSRAIPGQAGQQAQGDIARQIQQGQQSFQQSPARQASPTAAGAGQIAGKALMTAPMAALPMGGAGLAGRAGMSGIASMLAGSTEPVLHQDFWSEKGKQLAAAGTAGVALGGLGGMIGPAVNPVMQKIAAAFPNLARMATGAEGRSIDAFNRATANEVLHPLGLTVPRDIKPGHDLINYVDGKASEAYNNILPKVTFRADDEFRASLQGIKGELEGKPFADRVGVQIRKIGEALDENGAMTGQKFKQIDSALGTEAADNSIKTAGPDHIGYARALRGLQADMRDALVRSNGEQAVALRNADSAWAMNLRLQDAAGRDINGRGKFDPTDLLYVIRNGGGSAKKQFAKNDRLMQSYAEAAGDLLDMKPPAMEKMQRLIADIAGMSAGGAIGHAVLGPTGGFAGAMAGHFGRSAAAGITDPLVSGAFRATQTPAARAVGQGVSGAAPAAGAGAARMVRRPDTLTIAPEDDPHVSAAGP